MVDLYSQQINKKQIDSRLFNVIENSNFINGADVSIFSSNLSKYLKCKYKIPCANGTDALQIALMALDLKKG